MSRRLLFISALAALTLAVAACDQPQGGDSTNETSGVATGQTMPGELAEDMGADRPDEQPTAQVDQPPTPAQPAQPTQPTAQPDQQPPTQQPPGQQDLAQQDPAQQDPAQQQQQPSQQEVPTQQDQATATRVELSQKQGLGDFLVDAQGRSLYLFMADEGQGASTCYDQCAEAWPPLLINDQQMEVGQGLDASLVSTVSRTDGTRQVTYNGWPLYYFVSDRTAGDTAGQDVEGFGAEWYLVSPQGEPVRTEGS